MKKTLLTICLVWMCFSLSAQKLLTYPEMVIQYRPSG